MIGDVIILTGPPAFADLGNLEHHALDTGAMDVDRTAAEVRLLVASGACLLR
ncbi:hypothetical protein [Nocardia bovistercoris]|uniref:Uncharacterized protein n=1 Tax=Nocardia bovistercoris TaxID=2785916 RepID=A0A931MYL7_9NOCA|nr:hypothetical protein [Nocardia bovistercoris]MBH0775160.1 hypothetical protein [Nocardia bovistercoris]